MTPIELYTWRYPQLTFQVEPGMSEKPEYLSVVRRGILPEHPVFPYGESGEEELLRLETPIGIVEALYLPDRQIFEHFVRVLAYRCEPAELPGTMGAMMISGLNNWRKIEAHKEEYLKRGSGDWKEEFAKFTGNKENYKDTVILVGRGSYSAISPKETGYSVEEWMKKSKIIRICHELSHVVSRKLFPENRQTVRDEVVADSIGLLAACKSYDKQLAGKLLGIHAGRYRTGGRLENYVQQKECQEMAQKAEKLMEELEMFYASGSEKGPMEYLIMVEKEKAGLGIFQ